MIHVLIGTRAQLIKMAPIILELERREIELNLVMTGQHQETMAEILRDFAIASTCTWLYTRKEISGLNQVIPWFCRCLWRLSMGPSSLPSKGASMSDDIVMVHGDTFSTLLGALAGRMRGLRVAHVESGLRSFNAFHPFPEELTRRVVFRLTDIAFCPDEWSLSNLKRRRMLKVVTRGNTLIDALRVALKVRRCPPLEMPKQKFGVVSLHRFENIFFKKKLSHILSLLKDVAPRYPLVFVLHPATRRNLLRYGYMSNLMSDPNFHLWPRMGYFEFVTLLKHAAFIITDGGSNQEELAYLKKPTLLMRRATERKDGLGSNVVLSDYDKATVLKFVDLVDSWVDAPVPVHELVSPSAIIVDMLQALRDK